ncbi:hypothetical protein SAMN05660690_0501 [Geodermatophilus telluris]|uniref:Uncharacterized protein n=1 Tax=Geodermatophilus telluris TaxID=1190417 RepID=A0A1G6IT32_9ACTN|nr:hypothetical protein [Geodermatophilus telluris]SDC09195.1 hypothetical protein SAMN05660690_0501 [Geodermatophilus telluris]
MTATDERLSDAALVDDADLPDLPPSFLRTAREVAATSAGPATVVPFRAPARSRRRLAVGTVAAAGAAAALVLVPGGTAPRAVADYAYVPDRAAPAAQAALVAACTEALARTADGDGTSWAAEHPFDPAEQRPAVVDVRGPWGLTVLVGGGTVGDCLSGPDGVVGTARQELRSSLSSAPAAGVRTAGLGTTRTSGGGDRDGSTAYGRSAPDVAAVELVLPGREVVTATVADGWWAAWWPGATDDDRAVRVRVTDGAGLVTTSALADTY